MFKVNDYRIVFKRVWHSRKRNGDGCYDTKCEIYNMEDESVGPSFTGIARLHPNDKPDKVVGKKIALRNAIGVWDSENEEWSYSCAEFFNKEVRTAIWAAFWGWVDQWPNQPSNRIKETMEAIDTIGKSAVFGGERSKT